MDIKKTYGMGVKNITQTKGGYILKLSRIKYMLKEVSAGESEITAAAAIINHVNNGNFRNIISIKKDVDGKAYIKSADKIYVLVDTAGGKKFKLKTRENGIVMAELLAKFHNSAEGFIQFPGVKVKVDWGKRMEKCRVMTARLEKYCNALKKGTNNGFEELTADYTEMLLKRARGSMKILRSLDYLNCLEESMKRKEICLNAVSSNTAVVLNDKIIITKVFEMGYNMAEEDIAALIIKMIQETHDRSILEEILERYQSYRYLGEKSIDIVRALVSYPFDSIKIIVKYLKHPGEHEAYIEKFRGYVDKEQWTDILGV